MYTFVAAIKDGREMSVCGVGECSDCEVTLLSDGGLLLQLTYWGRPGQL